MRVERHDKQSIQVRCGVMKALKATVKLLHTQGGSSSVLTHTSLSKYTYWVSCARKWSQEIASHKTS